jgi:putative transcriptional regulator
MALSKKKSEQEPKEVNIGGILIAKPFWDEEAYKRSVVLVTEHDADGSRGIIINKETTVTVREALPDIDSSMYIYFGGPASSRMISYIHMIPQIPDADYMGRGIYLGGSPEMMQEMVTQNKIDFKKIIFCAGVVKWEPGELQKEIDENRWWVSKITADELFNSEAGTLWSLLLLKMENLYGLFAHIPDPFLKEIKAAPDEPLL